MLLLNSFCQHFACWVSSLLTPLPHQHTTHELNPFFLFVYSFFFFFLLYCYSCLLCSGLVSGCFSSQHRRWMEGGLPRSTTRGEKRCCRESREDRAAAAATAASTAAAGLPRQKKTTKNKVSLSHLCPSGFLDSHSLSHLTTWCPLVFK